MKVTFCAAEPRPNYVSGPNAWLKRLLPELRSRGITPQVLFPIVRCTEALTLNALRQQGIATDFLPSPTYTEQQLRWLLARLREDPPDVFVPNLILSALYAGRWVRQAGIPTIGVIHSDDPFYQQVIREFILTPSPYKLSGAVCVSQFLEQQLLSQSPQGVYVERIPCGVPVPDAHASRTSQSLRLVYVGRLEEEQKCISAVARSLCRTVREIPNTEAVLYGSGSARPAVEQILATQGAGLPIHLAGRVDSEQIQACLLNSHVLVLLSDYEGLPVSLMEAMACGLVPICLRIRSGIPELVEDGVTGLLVSDRDEDFVRAVRRLQTEPGLWERLSGNARAKIQSGYSHAACADRWAALCQKLQPHPGQTHAISSPRWLRLPPVRPHFRNRDQRQPSLTKKLIARSRHLVAKVKPQIKS